MTEPMMPFTILTNAPDDYDYGVTVKFSNPILGTKGLRLVECYTEEEEGPGARWRMEQQALRYSSGLYVAIVEPSREDYNWYRTKY